MQYTTWVARCDTTEYHIPFSRHLEELQFLGNVCLVSRRGGIFPRASYFAHFSGYLALALYKANLSDQRDLYS